MKHKPLVSVIIPAYNAMAYLPDTIQSLLNQGFTDYEALVINDGSTDTIEQWFSNLKDPRVRLVSQANQGLAGARNTGIEYSVGQYLAFLDADDLWSPTKLLEQVRILNDYPAIGLVYTWVEYIDEKGKSTGRLIQNEIEGDVWQGLTKLNLVECGSVAMVRRECFDRCGVFDRELGSFVEDWDMWLRIASCFPFKVIKEPLVYYRQRASSASRDWHSMAKSYRAVIEKAFATAPFELLYLRGKSYGCANFVLAWKALQGLSPDLQQTDAFRIQALRHDPQLRFSKEHLRLFCAIGLMKWLGMDGYDQFLSVLHSIRRRTVFSRL
jgi:glycosyltransferase involved in cell wall biosynthesis